MTEGERIRRLLEDILGDARPGDLVQVNAAIEEQRARLNDWLLYEVAENLEARAVDERKKLRKLHRIIQRERKAFNHAASDIAAQCPQSNRAVSQLVEMMTRQTGPYGISFKFNPQGVGFDEDMIVAMPAFTEVLKACMQVGANLSLLCPDSNNDMADPGIRTEDHEPGWVYLIFNTTKDLDGFWRELLDKKLGIIKKGPDMGVWTNESVPSVAERRRTAGPKTRHLQAVRRPASGRM